MENSVHKLGFKLHCMPPADLKLEKDVMNIFIFKAFLPGYNLGRFLGNRFAPIGSDARRCAATLAFWCKS